MQNNERLRKNIQKSVIKIQLQQTLAKNTMNRGKILLTTRNRSESTAYEHKELENNEPQVRHDKGEQSGQMFRLQVLMLNFIFFFCSSVFPLKCRHM